MPAERRVYIVDDDEAVRDSLSVLLESRAYAVRSFGSAPEFLAAAASLPVGCLNSLDMALSRLAASSEQDPTATAAAAKLALLSPREREVLEGLLAGLPNKTIAYDLAISPRTVEIHRARVMDKMGARSLSELVRLALAAGVRPSSQ